MIKDLPSDQRPREKLLARGPQALADSELLALLLRTGVPGQGVLALAEAVLAQCKGFGGLLQAGPAQMRTLTRIKGLGPAKCAELMAVMEMARRAMAQGLREAPALHSPALVRDYLLLQLSGLQREVFVVMFLDVHLRLIALERMFEGTLAQTQIHPREVVRRALEHNASAVVLAHNHPSGVAEPSKADELITQSIIRALLTVEIRVLDHVVVGSGSTVSFAERGLL